MTIRTIICKRCQNKVSIDYIKYDRNGRDLICVPCFQRGPVEARQVSSEREKLMCMKCNYKFAVRRDSRVARKCAYCGGVNLAPYEAVTAQQVIHEVTENPQTSFLR